MIFWHRQSWRTAYRSWARPAPTGPDLGLTAICSPGLPFNGLDPRDPYNYVYHYSFTDPGGMEGWVGLVDWPVADTFHAKWSHVNHRSGVDQGKCASQRSWKNDDLVINLWLTYLLTDLLGPKHVSVLRLISRIELGVRVTHVNYIDNNTLYKP